jgi:alpha-tubulin suppressor-like RCC1 family protein
MPRALACLLVLALTALAACGGSSSKPDDPPTVTLPPQIHALVGTVSLPAAGSQAGLTYTWTQTSGPEDLAVRGSTTARPAVTVRRVGTYGFTVVAHGSGRDSATATTTLHVHDIDGGEDFTVALKPDGTLWTWGDTGWGELGDGDLSGTPRATPGRVCAPGTTTFPCSGLLEGIVAVAAGRAHVVALDLEGGVWTWGDNSRFQLGNGDETHAPSAVPTRVCAVGDTGAPCTTFLQHAVAIAAGYLFSAALLDDGTVVTWGDNSYGQLGNDLATGASSRPVEVCAVGATGPCSAADGNSLGGVLALTAGGGGHALALLDDGAVVGWGHDKNGQVGAGDWDFQIPVPTPVCNPGDLACAAHLGGIAAVDAWSGQSLALGLDGALWSWGSNDQGELGAVSSDECYGGAICSLTPVRVCASGDSPCTTPLGDVVSMAAGRRFAMSLDAEGQVRTWGAGAESSLGRGDVDDDPIPGRVCAPGAASPCATFLSSVTGVAAGSFHALALDAGGMLWAWGDNDFGQLGTDTDGVDATVPIPVAGY